MTTLLVPPPAVTKLIAGTVTAWRIRRNHRHRTARMVEIYCQTCQRWLKPRRFHRNTVICRTCTNRRSTRH